MRERGETEEGSDATDARFRRRRFAAGPAADRTRDPVVSDRLAPDDRSWLATHGRFFLSTIDDEGLPRSLHVQGAAGFVQVKDVRTLRFPWSEALRGSDSAADIDATGVAGLLFEDPESRRRLRVNGYARVLEADAADQVRHGTRFVVEVQITNVFRGQARWSGGTPGRVVVRPGLEVTESQDRSTLP